MTRHFKVRRKIAIGLGVLPWLNKPVLGASMRSSTPAEQCRVLAHTMVDLLPHRSSAATIGKLYLRHRPSEAEIEALVRGICSGDEEQFVAAINDGPALRQLLRDRSRMDFVQGSTFKLEGCLMSVTELRWLALAALA